MSLPTSLQQQESTKRQGEVLVRRFTANLKGETTIERAAISAQEEEDATMQEARRARLQALYQDVDPSDLRFHEMDAARLALEKACKQLETEERPSTFAKFGVQRKPTRTTANEAMLKSAVHDFNSLQAIVAGFESQWVGQQTRAGQRFRTLCSNLDRYKSAFDIFPSQSVYTSALCGSLALIVNAAVNHSDFADKLSEMVADIAEKATDAAEMVIIHRTKDFRELFANLYSQIFFFFRDTIQWYAKSKVSRAFDSFNANLVKPYEKVVARIDGLVIRIFRKADVARSAMMTMVVEDLEDRRRLQRRAQVVDKINLASAGRRGQRLMLTMYESATFEDARDATDGDSQIVQRPDDKTTSTAGDQTLKRAQVQALSESMKRFVVGSEGPSLFRDGRFWLPEVDISFKLSDWMNPDAQMSSLWIEDPAMRAGFPSPRAAAIVAAVTAWESGIPVISHFCERPRGDMPEKPGLIGLVYSLIIQLLQFNVEDDSFEISKERLVKLDGSQGSWPDALLLLQDLLRTTPHLQQCIIDGLNDLTFGNGCDWCGAFLKMLFEHQKTSALGLKILLTTSGQSRVLPDYIQARDKTIVQRGAREVIRGGRWLSVAER